MNFKKPNAQKVGSAAQENSNMTDHYVVPTNLAPHVFRLYDIRGEADETGITPNLAYAIGLAIGTEVLEKGRKTIAVGRDGRLSGPMLKKALIQGIIETGCDVIDIGTVATPVLYFATHFLSTDCGVMVTASHNPGHHNGFKIVLAKNTLTTEAIQALYSRIQKQAFQKGQGSISEKNIIDDYISAVCDRTHLSRKLKIVIDCGNGAASEIAPKLFEKLGCEVLQLFCTLDGNFPNHHPDPTVPENLRDMIDAVKSHNADIGLAFDGDADRVGMVTNTGEIIWPDRQLMLLAIDVLSRNQKAPIVFDVKCTRNLAIVIREHGGKPIMSRTGHSLLKAKMQEVGAPLAGEMSGHIFFKENWYGFDDGMYVGARILQALSDANQSANDLFHALPNSVNTPELKLPLAEERKADFMEKLSTQAHFGESEKVTIDGLRLEFPYGWGLIRPSNTSPYLTMRFEADTEESLEKLKTLFREQLLKIDPTLSLPF
jgi:phosphomannomutase/phosphoglucomutase